MAEASTRLSSTTRERTVAWFPPVGLGSSLRAVPDRARAGAARSREVPARCGFELWVHAAGAIDRPRGDPRRSVDSRDPGDTGRPRRWPTADGGPAAAVNAQVDVD